MNVTLASFILTTLSVFLFVGCSTPDDQPTSLQTSMCETGVFDFGLQTILTSGEATLTFTNESGAIITAINADPTTPFSFKGGAFPGTGGTCATELGVGESCTLVVSFTPPEIQAYEQVLTVQYTARYKDTSVTCNITGTGTRASGILDTSFHSDGMLLSSIGNSPVSAGEVAVQTDGKMITVGGATESGLDKFAVFRFKTSGALDSAFHTDGKLTTSGPAGGHAGALAVVILTGGKFAVGGYGTPSGADFMMIEYHGDGTLNTSFHTDGKTTFDIAGGSTDTLIQMAVQTDGKFLSVGAADNGIVLAYSIARVLPNGQLDSTFHTDGKDSANLGGNLDEFSNVKIDSDGRIYGMGFSDSTGSEDILILRFLTGGVLDTAFHTDGKAASGFSVATVVYPSLALQTDGKLAIGSCSTDSNYYYQILRFKTSGNLDTAFHTDGRTITTPTLGVVVTAGPIEIQTNGKILLGITYPKAPIFVYGFLRYLTNGNLDTAFGALGMSLSTFGTDILSRSYTKIFEGKIVQAGLQGRVGGDFYFGLAQYWQ